MSTSAPALAVYGSLAPGESNHHVMDGIDGAWRKGTIRGRRWHWTSGPYAGYPGFEADPDGDDIEVMVVVSDDLPAHWSRLDSFEGPGYRRVTIPVTYLQGSEAGPATAWVYEAMRDYAGGEGVGPAF